MAYGKDNNRGVHATSPSGGPSKMPDGFCASVGSLTGNKGLLGQNPGNPTSRQDIPGSAEISPREQYNFTATGEKELLGQNPHEGLKDTNYPSLPNPDLPGESGTTNMGQQGDAIDFNAVAPYEYPDFGDWPNPSRSDPTAGLGQ